MNSYFDENLYFSSFGVNGASFTFLLNSRKDHIQRFLADGTFYEAQELEMLSRYCATRKRLLDIGANIGNHSIFLAHHLNLERVTPIEPNPAILHILKANLGLNWHPSFDLKHLGIALSDRAGWAQIGSVNEANIGGTSIIPATRHDAPVTDRHDQIRVLAGDDLFQPNDFDIIKIDVEGMEIQVLRGLSILLRQFTGVIMVEVRDDNISDFTQVIADMRFRKVDEYRRYAKCSNWILTR